MKALNFDFENVAANAKTLREITKILARAGAQAVSSEVSKTTTRRAGVTFRNANFTFADGQIVVMGVKSTGDVFEVRINGKLTPLRYQDDHIKGLGEIASIMDRGRGIFQKRLARMKIPLPPSIKISRTSMLAVLTEKRDTLLGAVKEARDTLAGLTPAAA